jgi:hypothetical protein
MNCFGGIGSFPGEEMGWESADQHTNKGVDLISRVLSSGARFDEDSV